MSESLNTVKADGCEARDKAVQATVTAEAVRQRETPSPCWLRNRDAKPKAQTYSEARCSIVTYPRSNAVSEGAAPLRLRQRQHLPLLSALMEEPSGVAGWAGGEGCSIEGGRSATVLNELEGVGNWLQRTRPTWSRRTIQAFEVRGAISATREGRPNSVAEVGGDDNSYEVPVMGIEAKRPHFDDVTEVVTGCSSHRNV